MAILAQAAFYDVSGGLVDPGSLVPRFLSECFAMVLPRLPDAKVHVRPALHQARGSCESCQGVGDPAFGGL